MESDVVLAAQRKLDAITRESRDRLDLSARKFAEATEAARQADATFTNKVKKMEARVREMIRARQEEAARPFAKRQEPRVMSFDGEDEEERSQEQDDPFLASIVNNWGAGRPSAADRPEPESQQSAGGSSTAVSPFQPAASASPFQRGGRPAPARPQPPRRYDDDEDDDSPVSWLH